MIDNRQKVIQLHVGWIDRVEATVGQAISTAALPRWKCLIEVDDGGRKWAGQERIGA